MPLLPKMLRDLNIPGLSDFLGDVRIMVPIGGTLAKPEVNHDAFNRAKQDMHKTFVQRNVTRGVAELFRLILPPREPEGGPPP
jgi:hypothetical protein